MIKRSINKKKFADITMYSGLVEGIAGGNITIMKDHQYLV